MPSKGPAMSSYVQSLGLEPPPTCPTEARGHRKGIQETSEDMIFNGQRDENRGHWEGHEFLQLRLFGHGIQGFPKPQMLGVQTGRALNYGPLVIFIGTRMKHEGRKTGHVRNFQWSHQITA